jgi:hypothetical protein
MRISRRSLLLLVLQLLIVSSIAAKYLYQRATCPRVWTRAVAYDPNLVLRGRYLSMQLHIDACGVQLPPESDITHNHSLNRLFDSNGLVTPLLNTRIGVRDGKLAVLRLDPAGTEPGDLTIQIRRAAPCQDAILIEGVDFYIPEAAKSPFPLASGQQLWVEVTVPPKGPPRPLHLAISSNGQWHPLAF